MEDRPTKSSLYQKVDTSSNMLEIRLSESFFPLLPRFEDLEQQRRNAFSIDIMKCSPPKTSILQSFLQVEESCRNLGFTTFRQGFNFIEGSYMALKWSKKERRVLKMDILSVFLPVLLKHASAFSKILRTSFIDLDMKNNHQNNLRVCIYFLCHCICITEDNLQGGYAQAQDLKVLVNFEFPRWLELKTTTALLLSKLLQSAESVLDTHQDIQLAGELIRAAAVASLVHQKWGERSPHLKSLRKALIGIFSNSFLKPLTFAPEVTQETLYSLFYLCREHRFLTIFLVDMMEELIAMDKYAGISFLSKLVEIIVEKSKFTALTKEKPAQVQDDLETAMSIIADFAVRKDAIIVVGLYLGRLFPTLRNDRPVIRKYLSELVGGCLINYDLLSVNDQHVLAKIHSSLLKDRDATCRLRALTNLSANLKWNSFKNQDTFNFLFSAVLERILDKSKIVRLKAFKSLKIILVNSANLEDSQGSNGIFLPYCLQLELLSKVSKLLLLRSDSSYFCRQTIEAAGDLLCLTCLKGHLMFQHLDKLITSELCPSSLSIISKVLHAHLNKYDDWIQFLGTRSEASIVKLQAFMLTTIGDQIGLKNKLQDILIESFVKLKSYSLENLNNPSLLGSCMLIALLMSLEIFELPILYDGPNTLFIIVQDFVKKPSPDHCGATTIRNLVIKWALKALAVTIKSQQKSSIRGLSQFIQDQFINLHTEGIDGLMECVYSMNNPYGLVKKILHVYESELLVLDSTQPLKLLQSYISFLGDISRNSDLACHAFIKCLQDAQRNFSKRLSDKGTSLDVDYLLQEEQKAQEEDAVRRFSQMLLDGDSIPGCYVPFLKELVLSDQLPTSLRTAAIQSLGQYLLASNYVAETYKCTIECLLQSRESQIKVAALNLVEKLMIAFPNDFLSLLSFVVTMLEDTTVKNAAFTVYVRLILEEKFKVETLIGPICDGICDEDQNVRRLLVFVLKKLLKDGKGPKYKFIISLYNHCASAKAREGLVQILVENSLDNCDFESDELACLILQILALGQNDAAFFASFLHPSYKSLQILHSYLAISPPKINLREDPRAAEYLVRFVMNYRRHRASPGDKELVAKLLEQLQMKPKKKRKNQITSGDAGSTYLSVEEYEEAVESFKHCDISCTLWDLLKHDI